MPAMLRPIARDGPPSFAPRFSASCASAGPTSRSIDRTFWAAQPGRSVTFARASPCALRRPVVSVTRCSARAVSSSNGDWSAADRYEAGAGLRMSPPAATRSARAQSTMAGPAGGDDVDDVDTNEVESVGVRSVPGVVLLAFFVDRRGDPVDQCLGHTVLAPVRDHPAQVLLELCGAAARTAPVEVDTDRLSPGIGQLPVEIRVELVHRLDAVDGRAEKAARVDAGARPRRSRRSRRPVAVAVIVIAHLSVAHPITPRA